MSGFRRRSLPPVFPRGEGTATRRLILYIILSRTAFWKKISNHSVSSLILKQIICIDIRANVSRKQNRSRDFFREVNGSIALQSPYMQIRVKLSVLNENAAKPLHLHLDPASHCATWALRHVRLLSKNKRSK